MSLVAMAISTATPMPELMPGSRSLSAYSKHLGQRVIRSSPLSKAVAEEPFLCIDLSAKPSMVKSRPKKALCDILTDHDPSTFQKTWRGEVTLRMRLTNGGTAELPQVKSMGKSSFPRKGFALSEPRSHSAFGMLRTPQRCLAWTLQPFAASPQGNATGKTSSNTLHGPDAWDRNDWVAAYTFTVQRGNIDQVKS